MMSPDATSLLAEWPRLRAISYGLASATMAYAVCFVFIAFFELRAGKGLAGYASRHFWTDILYRAVFVVYSVVIYKPLQSVAADILPATQQNLITRAPLWLAVPIYWLLLDFFGYWIHRMQHSRLWWRFHRVHHSQERMTWATGWRNHPLDQLFAHLCILVPSLMLGAPVVAWLPYSFILAIIGATQHSGLDWRLGPLRYVFVSPIFHAAHHSDDPAVYDHNFSNLFSLWDFLFGTAYDAERLPQRTGVRGWQVRESFWAHFLSPFRRDTIAQTDDRRPPGGS